MRHAVVDKRVAGIVRWLERLKSSYSEGAMEIALMDAECARADLEDLRQDVFTKCSRANSKTGNLAKIFAPVLRVFFLALLIVILYVAPVARDIAPVPDLNLTQANNIVLAEPIIIIREDSGISENANKPGQKPAPAQTPRKPRKPAAKPSKPDERTVKPAQTPAVNKKVPYDQVLSLMQTGQRALNGNNTVITVK